MASIAEWIQKIKTAIYGEEVRGAIWQSLQAMNDELTSADVTQIPKNKQDIAGLKTDVTNLKASDTELKDIRVGTGGTTYESAGDAVRGQVNDLKEELNGYLFGDNLLRVLASDKTSNGITFTVSEKGIIANGTATGNAYIDVTTVTPNRSGIYKLSGCPSGGSISTFISYIPSTSIDVYDVGYGVAYKLDANQTYTVRIIVYSGYTADNLLFTPELKYMPNASDKITDIEEYALGYGKYNLFNPVFFDLAGWEKVSDVEYKGTANFIQNAFGTNTFPITFKPHTQYAITMEGYHEGDAVGGSYGLDFSFVYSDSTVGSRNCAFENARTSWTRKTAISDPSKSVIGIITPKNTSYDNFVWHIRNIMVVEGSDPNQYVPYIAVKANPNPYVDVCMISPGGKGGSVGTGILFRFPSFKRLLMDTHVDGYGVWKGSDGGFTTALKKESMTTKLRFDYLFISHYHADHVGGLIDWIDNGYLTNGKIDLHGATVFLPPEITLSNIGHILGDDPEVLVARQQKIVNALTEQSCTIIRPTEGQVVDIGDAKLIFTNCNQSVYASGGSYESTNYNDFSLCAYVVYGSQIFFYTADLGPIGEKYLSTQNVLLKSTVMTAPHHGWQASGETLSGANALYPDFINRICPDVVLSPNGDAHKPDSGRPASMFGPESAVQTWCEKNGISNYATCLNGTIKMKLFNQSWMLDGSYIRYIRNNKNWKYSDNSEYNED